jgi:hypothetical protein
MGEIIARKKMYSIDQTMPFFNYRFYNWTENNRVDAQGQSGSRWAGECYETMVIIP